MTLATRLGKCPYDYRSAGSPSPRRLRTWRHFSSGRADALSPASGSSSGRRRLTGTAYTAPPRVLGLLADDLTGAADSAVGFAEHGWQFELALRSAAPRMLNGPLDDGGRWLVSPDAGLVPLQSVAGGG